MKMRGPACLATIAAALTLAPAAGAGAATPTPTPTAVSVFVGHYGDGHLSGRWLVATQRVGSRRVRVSAYRVDHPLQDDIAFVLVLARGRCSSAGPSGKALARLSVADGKFGSSTYSFNPSALRRGASWYAIQTGKRKPLACSRLGRFAPFGAVAAPRDIASGEATGKRRGLVVFRRSGSRVRVTQLLDQVYGGGDTGTHEIGASGHTCGEPFTATDDLWQWRKNITDPFMDYNEESWDLAATKSIAVVRTGAPAGPPVLCTGIDVDRLGP